MNDGCFEDHERTLKEIKSLFFNTTYFWTAAYVSPLMITYHKFHVLFVPISLVVPLVYFMCTWGALHFFTFRLIIKEKEKEND
jgi:hypothetical protein